MPITHILPTYYSIRTDQILELLLVYVFGLTRNETFIYVSDVRAEQLAKMAAWC